MAIVKISQKHKEYEIGYSCVIENRKKFIQTIKIFRDLCGFLLNRKYSMLHQKPSNTNFFSTIIQNPNSNIFFRQLLHL